MVIMKFRSSSEARDMLKKAKSMYKFSKELVECLEDKYEDEFEDDYESEYRTGADAYGRHMESDSEYSMRGGRYRRGGGRM